MRVFLSAGKKVYFTLLASSFMFPISAFAQCVDTQDCQTLGYTETSDSGNCIKCFFGNYWACPGKNTEEEPEKPEEPEGAVLGQCTGYAKNCKIADILNSDGTCTSDKVSGKTPIGVVVYISGGTDKCGYAMTASPIATDIAWSTENVSIGTFRSSKWQEAIKDFDVSGNMTKFIQTGNPISFPAAYAALNYVPSAAPTTKGKWALPTAGILNSLYTNLNAINNAISKVGGKQLTNDNEHIWSSSEADDDFAWVFCMNNGAYGGMLGNNKSYYIESDNTSRPVLAF